nr:hypothetical protein [Tanacetum cinerariifolium]
MNEYIRLKEEKARKQRKVVNWETAKYGKIWYDEDVHDLRSVETEFPALVFNENLISNETLFCEPMVNMPLFPSPEPSISCIDDLDFFKEFENEFPAIVYNDALMSKSDFLTKQHIDEFDLKDETSVSAYDEVEQNDIADFEERLERIHDRRTHRVHVLDFKGMPELMMDVMYTKMWMEHRDGDEVVVFTSQKWSRVFETRGPLVRVLILEFLSTLRFGEVLLELDNPGTLQSQLGGAKRRMSWRDFILAL